MINKLNLIKPFKDKDNISVVYATDENNVKYLYTSLMSLIDHSNLNFNYDILVFYSSLNDFSIKNIESLSKDNVLIRCIQIKDDLFSKLNSKKDISIETYLRLYILDLYNYAKIIYLDTDVLIASDISALFKIDIGDNYIGAVRDIIGIGIANSRTGYKRKKEYELLNINYMNYFNAGVLIFNLTKLRKICIRSNELIHRAIERKYIWQDQDLLNVEFNKKVYFLDYEWNFSYHHDHCIECSYAPKEMYKSWSDTIHKYKIIHFAGRSIYKPWFNKSIPFSDLYWNYANKSIYKSEIKKACNNKKISVSINRCINWLFPVCSRRRVFFKRMFK